MKEARFVKFAEDKVGKLKYLFTFCLSKWLYVAIILPSAVIVYNIFEALQKKNFFLDLSSEIEKIVNESVRLSSECSKFIGSFDDFFVCIGF